MSEKKNISVRFNVSDLRRVKDISRRVQVRESDIYRFAVKSTINNLMPLLEAELSSRELMLALVDYGEEIIRYFAFDFHQLQKMLNLNGRTDDVELEDVRLLAIASANPEYLAAKLTEHLGRPVQTSRVFTELREYLHNKYRSKAYSPTDESDPQRKAV